MRILYVITSLSTGGAEKLMVDILPGLRSLGNDVELLVFNGTRTPFYEALEQRGIKINCLKVGGNVYSPLNILKLRKYVSQFDVIHTHNTACQLFVPIAKKLFCGTAKLVTTEHNTTNRRRGKWYFKPIDKWMYKQYSEVISISQKATDLLHAYIGRNNIHTIDNGINLTIFSNAKPIDKATLINDYNSGDVMITMVAGFRVQKDQDCAIRALTHLPENYKVCLVGDGERRPEIEALVEELDLKHRVNLLGIRSDIPQILATSDVNLLASHWEGLSLSSVEGMASGKPFLASDVNGLREVVGGNGILFPDGDDEALAREIKALIDNPQHYKEVANRCKQAASKYDIRNTIKTYNDLYHQILE